MVKIYIVTGASRGLGLEFVRQIVAAGNVVFACARNPDASTALMDLVDNKKVFAVKLDTVSQESIKVRAGKFVSIETIRLNALKRIGCCCWNRC